MKGVELVEIDYINLGWSCRLLPREHYSLSFLFLFSLAVPSVCCYTTVRIVLSFPLALLFLALLLDEPTSRLFYHVPKTVIFSPPAEKPITKIIAIMANNFDEK